MAIADIFGWIGSICYSICAVPQVIMCIKSGHARGFSRGLAFLTIIGAAFSFVYALPNRDYILLLNFSLNIILSAIILKYSYFERS